MKGRNHLIQLFSNFFRTFAGTGLDFIQRVIHIIDVFIQYLFSFSLNTAFCNNGSLM